MTSRNAATARGRGRRAVRLTLLASTAALISGACSRGEPGPTEVAGPGQAETAWGPETPHFNLEVILREAGGPGFGLVKFRQPNDENAIVFLDTWVRDLAANTSYSLQRAVDAVIDDVCTSASGWLTLGAGLAPLAIITDDRGTGRAELFRDLGGFAPGSEFDIHFRIIETGTEAAPVVVLTSACYQFTISL